MTSGCNNLRPQRSQRQPCVNKQKGLVNVLEFRLLTVATFHNIWKQKSKSQWTRFFPKLPKHLLMFELCSCFQYRFSKVPLQLPNFCCWLVSKLRGMKLCTFHVLAQSGTLRVQGRAKFAKCMQRNSSVRNGKKLSCPNTAASRVYSNACFFA